MAARAFVAQGSAPRILTMPGLDGSGPDHWQSHWEALLPNCLRVEVKDWSEPCRNHWVDQLDEAIRGAAGPLVIAAHSLGCFAVAWWAKLRWSEDLGDRLLGALLVAPPRIGRECDTPRLFGFRPEPLEAMPFNSMLVASRDDRYCSLAAARELADRWGSSFVDAGPLGHINARSGIGAWDDGLALLEGLMIGSRRRTASRRRGRTEQPALEVAAL